MTTGGCWMALGCDLRPPHRRYQRSEMPLVLLIARLASIGRLVTEFAIIVYFLVGSTNQINQDTSPLSSQADQSAVWHHFTKAFLTCTNFPLI
jgi:TRAP-type mannitol/chloroaromatic compound transport system permease small subunit